MHPSILTLVNLIAAQAVRQYSALAAKKYQHISSLSIAWLVTLPSYAAVSISCAVAMSIRSQRESVAHSFDTQS